MRYAFLTTEFPTTLHGGGGLATYTRRMARLLAAEGHEVEVFVLDNARADTLRQEGYIVHHVRHRQERFTNLGPKLYRKLGAANAAASLEFSTDARTIAAALEARHVEKPFDVVQSPDHRGLGGAVVKRPGRAHVVRCSAAMDLYMAADGRSNPVASAQIAAERAAIMSADLAIAPSKLVSDHYSNILGRKVHVVRPPAYLEEMPGQRPFWLPPRYLVHFAGWLGARKGTEQIARALPDAISEAPDLVMLWFGRLPGGNATKSLRVCPNNLLTASPLGKPTLYRVLQDSAAVVLLSQVDNIPNSLIETLLLGAPVIASRGASMDEMLEPSASVEMVDIGDVQGTSQALVRAWRGDLKVNAVPWSEQRYGFEFTPENALNMHLSALSQIGVKV